MQADARARKGTGTASSATRGARRLHDLLEALRSHDHYTAGHSRRVASYGALLARLVGLAADETQLVHDAALAHDLGKLAIPYEILTKRNPLTDQEFHAIQGHPVEGASMLSRLPEAAALMPIVLHHHEHWNGRGYPTGLAGVDIPLESRIILVADAFDAMTTARPYDPMISSHAAMAEIRHCSGQQFDPLVVAALETAMDRGLLQASELAPALLR